MPTARTCLFILLLGIPLFSFGQERVIPFFTTKNFITYRIGFGYPFFSNGSKFSEFASASGEYDFFDRSINYSFHGGFGFGHSFGRNFSIAISPYLMYSKFAEAGFHYESRTAMQKSILRTHEGYFHNYHLGFLFPLEFNFKIKENWDFAVGVFILKPVMDRVISNFSETDYRQSPPKVYNSIHRDYKNKRSDPRGGAHCQFSFLLSERDWQQKRINIEYYHSFTKANFEVYEKWIMVAFKKVFYK